MSSFYRMGLIAFLGTGAFLGATLAVAQPVGPNWGSAPSYDYYGPWGAPMRRGWQGGLNRPYPAEAYDVPPPPSGWMEPPQRPQSGRLMRWGQRYPAQAYEVPPPPTDRREPPKRPEPPSPPQGQSVAPWSYMGSGAQNIDSDTDGVPNLTDICPGTSGTMSTDIFGCDADKPLQLRHVKFHAGTADLTDESSAVLDSIAATLSANPGVGLEISGYVHSAGDYAENMQLSARRAVNVMKYLAAQGVDTSDMIARGMGDGGEASGEDRIELLTLD